MAQARFRSSVRFRGVLPEGGKWVPPEELTPFTALALSPKAGMSPREQALERIEKKASKSGMSVAQLVETFQREGFDLQRAPAVSDADPQELVVTDGLHRMKALMNLGVERIPVAPRSLSDFMDDVEM